MNLFSTSSRFYKYSILILGLCLFLNSCSYNKEAIYILPEGFVGPFVILFEQKDGVTLSTENGFNLYKIPKSGILKVKGKPILTVHDEKFFFEKPNGTRSKIEYLYPSIRGKNNSKTFDQIKKDDPTIFVMGREDGTFNTGNNSPTRYRALKVGIASSSEILNQQTRDKIDILQ